MNPFDIILTSAGIGIIVYLVVAASIVTYFDKKRAFYGRLLESIGKGFDGAAKKATQLKEALEKIKNS